MSTPFEDFVTAELARRPTMLTAEQVAGYTGDPNDSGAPIELQLAPKGTFYLRDSDAKLWKKNTDIAGSWEQLGA